MRRGCVSLCPNGSLRAGHGSRFVLADTEELHSRIAQMSQRIRQLEDALAVSHAGESKERHPLLREELLSLKFGSDFQLVKEESDDDVSLSFGTLTLTDSGGSKYFGVSAGALAALLAEEELVDPDAQSQTTGCSPGLTSLLGPSVLGKQGIADGLNALRSCVPPRARALSLCEIYLDKFYFQPVERGELMDDILISVYDANNMTLKPHKAAVLFMVFAVAALVDPGMPPYSTEAETYYLMGMRALDLRCISTSPDMETVMALSLVAAYHGGSLKSRSLDTAWSSMSLAIKVAQKIGLHREPSHWNLDPVYAQKRRHLFWCLMFQDGIRSLVLGRPPTMSLSWVDCRIPDANDDVKDILFRFKYSLARDVLWPMLDILQSTSPTSYNTILDLDKKIHELSLSSNLPSEEDCTSPAMDMHWYLSTHCRYILLLCIHRPFLALALLQYPENPLESPYAPSVLAAQSSASVIIRTTARQFEKDPVTYMRLWSVWIYLFNAAIVAGSIVSRAFTLPSSSITDLDLALSLFEKGADTSRHAKLILPFVQQLKGKAYGAYTRSLGRNPSQNLRSDESKNDICLYPGHAPVLSSKNLDDWSPHTVNTPDLRDSQSPPQTPPFLNYAQPGYPSLPAQYSTQSRSGMQTVSFDQHLHQPIRESFDFSSTPSFPQSSASISQGLPMCGDLFFHRDASLFPGELNPQSVVNEQWLSLMQDSGIDFAH